MAERRPACRLWGAVPSACECVKGSSAELAPVAQSGRRSLTHPWVPFLPSGPHFVVTLAGITCSHLRQSVGPRPLPRACSGGPDSPTHGTSTARPGLGSCHAEPVVQDVCPRALRAHGPHGFAGVARGPDPGCPGVKVWWKQLSPECAHRTLGPNRHPESCAAGPRTPLPRAAPAGCARPPAVSQADSALNPDFRSHLSARRPAPVLPGAPGSPRRRSDRFP